jgi:hypothetical protein
MQTTPPFAVKTLFRKILPNPSFHNEKTSLAFAGYFPSLAHNECIGKNNALLGRSPSEYRADPQTALTPFADILWTLNAMPTMP